MGATRPSPSRRSQRTQPGPTGPRWPPAPAHGRDAAHGHADDVGAREVLDDPEAIRVASPDRHPVRAEALGRPAHAGGQPRSGQRQDGREDRDRSRDSPPPRTHSSGSGRAPTGVGARSQSIGRYPETTTCTPVTSEAFTPENAKLIDEPLPGTVPVCSPSEALDAPGPVSVTRMALPPHAPALVSRLPTLT